VIQEARMSGGRRRVVLVGVGGLGSGSALVLARAGVEELVLVDPDRLEPSNLGRQVLYRQEDLGAYKAERAATRLMKAFPGVRGLPRVTALEPGNAARLLAGADLVVDGLDGFGSRLVLADACGAAGIPLVHAGVLRFGGQALTVRPGRTACYRCLLPEPPPPGEGSDPAREGVLGALVGLFGAVEGAEARRVLAGQPGILEGRLWALDLLGRQSLLLPLGRDPDCPSCGKIEKRYKYYPNGSGPASGPAPGSVPASSGQPRSARRARYQRQIRLREVGEAGQARLDRARVRVLGAGPGSWTAALYLAAAGVGRLEVEDPAADLDDLRGLNPEIVVSPATDSREETLDVDPCAAWGLLPAPLAPPIPELAGAAAAAEALLHLLGLA
jgi:adenylyltransferase/sulfurtransferase